jgi:hypothetical protein
MDVWSDVDCAGELSSERSWAVTQFAGAPLPDERLKRGW